MPHPSLASQIQALDRTSVLHELYTNWVLQPDISQDEDAAMRRTLAREFGFYPDPRPERPPLYPFPLRRQDFEQKSLYWYDDESEFAIGDARRIRRVYVKPQSYGYFLEAIDAHESVGFSVKLDDIPHYTRNDPAYRTLLPTYEDALRYDDAVVRLNRAAK